MKILNYARSASLMKSKVMHLSGINGTSKCGLPVEDIRDDDIIVYTENQLKREITLYSNPKLCYLCSTEFITEFTR